MISSSCSTSPLSRQAMTINFLAWLYGEESLFRSGTGLVYPIHLCSWVEKPRSPRQVLGNLKLETGQFPSSSWLLEKMQRTRKHLWNGKTYALDFMDRFKPASDAEDFLAGDRLHCTVGSYFDTVNTCTILEAELEQAIATLPLDASPQDCYQALPLRQKLHGDRRGQEALQDAWTGHNRSAAIAISCCFVVNVSSETDSKDEYRYFLHQRSAQVAEGAGQYHIVPSMIFQPTSVDPFNQQSYNLEATILREVAEELFDHEEGEQTVNLYPEIADLQALLVNGGATLLITGVAMDLLCLRPEFLALLWIRDRTWFERHGSSLKFSQHEYTPNSTIQESSRDITDPQPFQETGEFAPHCCVAAGAASALLARDYITQFLGC